MTQPDRFTPALIAEAQALSLKAVGVDTGPEPASAEEIAAAIRLLRYTRPTKAALIARELGLEGKEELAALRSVLREAGWKYSKGGYWRPPGCRG